MKLILTDGTRVDCEIEPKTFAIIWRLLQLGRITDMKIKVECPLTWLPIDIRKVDADRSLAAYGIDVVAA